MKENKFTVADYKKAVYEEFKDEINLVSKNSEKENWKADIGVATDMFITFIENATESIFVNVPKAKAKLAELNAKSTNRA
jgi:hypothetical protein